MSDQPVQEIIIVRRRSDGEDGHHGGVWKIAFADFMTAMMAFFLVLWIVNSTSKETRSSVARYFNPIKLSQTTPARKGLQDPKESDFEAGGGPAKEPTPGPEKAAAADEHAKPADPHAKPAKDEKPAKEAKDAKDAKPDDHAKKAPDPKPAPKEVTVGRLRPPVHTEEQLFKDPYGVLSEIVEGEPEVPAASDAEARVKTAGMPFRDPFAMAIPVATVQKASATVRGDETRPAGGAARATATAAAVLTAPVSVSGQGADPVKLESGLPDAAAGADAARIGAQIADAVRQQAKGAPVPDVQVVQTGEGLLISLTDKVDFGMFAVGSSEPQARTVRVLEAVARQLKDRPGPLVVRGYTDARPFKNGGSDNWRLSSSRAQMAFHMLVRGGVDEKRFERIEGRADRSLKNAAQPEAPENRRIEILLRQENR